MTATLANIRPAILEVTDGEGPHTVENKKFVQKVTERNARDAAALLTARSEVLGDLVSEHKLLIVPAVLDVSSGVATWLSDCCAEGQVSGRQAPSKPSHSNAPTGKPTSAPGSRDGTHVFRDPDGDKQCAQGQDHDRHCGEER